MLAGPPTEPTPPPPSPALRIDWRKVGSLRVLLGAAIPALIVGALFGLIWQPLAWAWVPFFVVWWLMLVLSPEHVLDCPFCSKRVKAGATTCHHCGRDVVPTTQGTP